MTLTKPYDLLWHPCQDFLMSGQTELWRAAATYGPGSRPATLSDGGDTATLAYVAGLDAVAAIAWTTATADSLSYARDAFHRLVSVGAGNSPVCAYTLNAKDQRRLNGAALILSPLTRLKARRSTVSTTEALHCLVDRIWFIAHFRWKNPYCILD